MSRTIDYFGSIVELTPELRREMADIRDLLEGEIFKRGIEPIIRKKIADANSKIDHASSFDQVRELVGKKAGLGFVLDISPMISKLINVVDEKKGNNNGY